MKEILSKEVALKKVIAGIVDTAKIVAVTMGGKGKNVILNVGDGQVKIINDGVSIARQVSFDHDPAKNTGAMLAKLVAEKTNEEAGDGTTTSIVLLQAYLEGIEKVKYGDGRSFREAVKRWLGMVIGKLEIAKVSISTPEEIERVAFISSLDSEIAEKIRSVIDVTGKDGVISLETGRKPGIEYEIVEGVRVNEGLIIPHLMTHNDRQVAEAHEVPIILTRKAITAITDIAPLLEELIKNDIKRCAIFTEEISDEVLTFFVTNKMGGLFSPIVVKTHDLDDLSVVTGAKIITPEGNLKFEAQNLGRAKRVTAGRNHTTVIGAVTKKDIDTAIEELTMTVENETDEYEKNRLKRRISRLSGGVAIVRVAGENDQETNERKLKLEDALNAAKAAIEEGIVAGGGVALWKIGEWLKDQTSGVSGVDEQARDLMIDVIQRPMRQILINAEEDVDSVELALRDSIKKGEDEDGTLGFNVVTEFYEKFIETGVIDPVKVTKSALQGAVNMGNQIITAEGAIVFTMEKPKE